jgi:hypothetical protein
LYRFVACVDLTGDEGLQNGRYSVEGMMKTERYCEVKVKKGSWGIVVGVQRVSVVFDMGMLIESVDGYDRVSHYGRVGDCESWMNVNLYWGSAIEGGSQNRSGSIDGVVEGSWFESCLADC